MLMRAVNWIVNALLWFSCRLWVGYNLEWGARERSWRDGLLNKQYYGLNPSAVAAFFDRNTCAYQNVTSTILNPVLSKAECTIFCRPKTPVIICRWTLAHCSFRLASRERSWWDRTIKLKKYRLYLQNCNDLHFCIFPLDSNVRMKVGYWAFFVLSKKKYLPRRRWYLSLIIVSTQEHFLSKRLQKMLILW